MKKIQILLMMLFLSNITFFVSAQEGFKDSFAEKYGIKQYEDLATRLYISKVVEIEGKSQKDLMTLFKNWGSTAFVNIREVMVSETDNQIVLVFITKINRPLRSMLGLNNNEIGLYVRMTGEFKDGKCRISLYDDGNVATLPSYYGSVTIPGSPSRSYYMSDVMKKLILQEYEWDYKKPENDKDYTKAKYANYPFVLNYQRGLETTLNEAVNGLKNPTSTSGNKRKDDF